MVLAFITGINEIPTLGFRPPLTIAFTHPEDDVETYLKEGIFANTCANTLYLPVEMNEAKLYMCLNIAIFEIGCLFTTE